MVDPVTIATVSAAITAILGAIKGINAVLKAAKVVSNADQLLTMFPQIGKRFPFLRKKVARWLIDFAKSQGYGPNLETRAEEIMAQDTAITGGYKKPRRKKGGRKIKSGSGFSSIKL